jgi:DnaJ-class molecular chaperone
MNQTKKVIKVCGRCNGTGYIITGGHQSMCLDCDAHGHTLVDKEVYYRQLQWEHKNRREKEK